ncbi:hypothetical protein EV1_031315 [Malus domestica]
MSGVSTAAYVACQAAQKEKVQILYRRAFRDTLNWAIHRLLFYPDADALRESSHEANPKHKQRQGMSTLAYEGTVSSMQMAQQQQQVEILLRKHQQKLRSNAI